MSAVYTNEVVLYGKRFPLHGPLRRIPATRFAERMTTGDYGRDDQMVSSSWVLSSLSGGLGVLYGDYPQHQDRYYFGTLNVLHNRQISLPQKVYKVGNLPGPSDVIIDYNSRLYRAVGATIYKVDALSETEVALNSTLSTPARAAAVFFGKLYILSENQLVEVDGDGNEAVYTDIMNGVAMVGWEDKLFIITNSNEIYWTIDPSDAGLWTYGGQLPLPLGYCRQLFIYQDMLGEPVIYAATSVGLWVYDFDAQMFYKTSMTFPYTTAAGKGVGVWRGESRVPVGMEGYLFNTNVVQPSGPNRDDGLPEAYRGDIDSFIPGHAFFYAPITIPGTPPDAGDLFWGVMPIDTGLMNNDTFVNPYENRGVVLLSTGAAWHAIHLTDSAGGKMGAGIVADIQGTHRFWFSTGEGLFWTPAPTALHNPNQIPDMEFEQTGFLETPWYDAGWQEIEKLAFSLEVFTRNCSPNRYIDFYAAWDEEDTWEHLGRVTTNGRISLPIGDIEGRSFYSVRLRIEMARGSDATLSPIIRNLIFTFNRTPRKLWAWQATIRMDGKYLDRTAQDLYNELMEIANSRKAGQFNFETEDGKEYNKRVLVSHVNSAHGVGTDKRGQFIITVIEIDSQHEVGSL